MKILVAYYSETGNTEKIAFAIYDSIHAEKEIKKVMDLDNPQGYDLIFFGFPVVEHSVPPQAAAGLKKIPEGQKIAFFSTHGSMRGGIKARQAFEHALGLAAKARVLGHFGCRGKVPSSLLEWFEGKIEHRAWAEEAAGSFRHPDENDMEDAKRFAAEMIDKL
ncbi:MAG TPA: flavodoxin family protein [Acidobacteriota bacterium]|nr:flavodoxin family protein [Acidobacteriota bacterium]